MWLQRISDFYMSVEKHAALLEETGKNGTIRA